MSDTNTDANKKKKLMNALLGLTAAVNLLGDTYNQTMEEFENMRKDKEDKDG